MHPAKVNREKVKAQFIINVKYKDLEEVRQEYPLVERLFKNGAMPPTIQMKIPALWPR